MSKTVCIYHSVDLDGYMSAAIVKHWFNQQEVPNGRRYCSVCERTLPNDSVGSTECCGGITTIDNNTIYFIGYNYGQPIPDLTGYDKVIMCDISFKTKEDGVKAMTDLYKRLGVNFIWIDHHLSAMNDNVERNVNKIIYNGLRGVTHAACELTWKYFFPDEPMPEIVRLLGRYDCFGHKGTDEELYVLEFQYGARQCINSYELAYEYLLAEMHESIDCQSIITSIHDSGRAIYNYLCTEAKQIYNNRFDLTFKGEGIYNFNTNGSVFYPTYKFAAINRERFNPINFGIDYHKDGYDGVACFWCTNHKLHFSLYNDNGLVDCSAIAKQFNGGGHKGAAGFILHSDYTSDTNNLYDLKVTLDSMVIDRYIF